jgi:hypothetical protein
MLRHRPGSARDRGRRREIVRPDRPRATSAARRPATTARPADVDQVVELAKAELRDLSERPVAAEELEDATA